MIKLEGLTKQFGDLVAVDHLDLEVAAGEIFVFLGPNGAGKTTTIKMIAGLLRPTEGRVFVCGHDVQQEHVTARLLLSYVPDQPFLYDKLTGREYLHFLGEMYNLERGGVEAKIARLSDLFDLDRFLDELAETYSHGMKQRIVISGALLHEPRVLIIDEPMVGLDPKNANTLKQMLRDMTAAGSAVFMSTHTLAVAEDVADRVGILRGGSLIAVGPLDEIHAQARTDGHLEEAFLRLTGNAGATGTGSE